MKTKNFAGTGPTMVYEFLETWIEQNQNITIVSSMITQTAIGSTNIIIIYKEN